MNVFECVSQWILEALEMSVGLGREVVDVLLNRIRVVKMLSIVWLRDTERLLLMGTTAQLP